MITSQTSLYALSNLLPSFVLTIDSIIKSSFGTLLKLHEVILSSGVVAVFTDAQTGIIGSKEQARFSYGKTKSAVLRGGWWRCSVG